MGTGVVEFASPANPAADDCASSPTPSGSEHSGGGEGCDWDDWDAESEDEEPAASNNNANSLGTRLCTCLQDLRCGILCF